jgi:2-succinyl-6-hydroxy-2,4-cyclohexadiene-1-carboxylate synthase
MTLLLLHGFTGSPSSWDDLLAALGPVEALRPALVGHGAEADHSGGFAAEVDRLATPLHRRDLANLHLVGYSMGARVALGLLCRYPERFGRATLIGVDPGLAGAERAARAEADERWARRVEAEGIEAFAAAWEEQPLFASQRRLPGSIRARERARRLGHRPAGLACALRQIGLGAMPDCRPGLPGVGCPIQLIVGELDPRFRALAVEAAARLPDGAVATVSGCGHNVTLERPDAVAALIRSHQGKERLP